MFSPFCLLQRADSGGEGGDETGGVDLEGYVDAGCVGVDQSGGIADGSASGAVKSPVSSSTFIGRSIQVTSDGSTATAGPADHAMACPVKTVARRP